MSYAITVPAAGDELGRVESLFNGFSDQWNDQAWTKSFRTQPNGYIRPRENSDWQVRMRALQGLVAAGADAIQPLVDELAEGDAPRRILAAQALGYLPAGKPDLQPLRRALLAAAESDADPAVRLYAVDALGMQGSDVRADLQRLREREENRDVKMHIGYALEREGRPLDPEVRRQLVEWDATHIDSARIGEPAPNFELPSLTGGLVRLSDYRGKKAVVLVFIYGDT